MSARDGDFREWRRLRALHLWERGWRRCDVAGALGVTERSVSHWASVARVRGRQGLLSAPIPGRPPALSPAQRQLIPEFRKRPANPSGSLRPLGTPFAQSTPPAASGHSAACWAK